MLRTSHQVQILDVYAADRRLQPATFCVRYGLSYLSGLHDVS